MVVLLHAAPRRIARVSTDESAEYNKDEVTETCKEASESTVLQIPSAIDTVPRLIETVRGKGNKQNDSREMRREEKEASGEKKKGNRRNQKTGGRSGTRASLSESVAAAYRRRNTVRKGKSGRTLWTRCTPALRVRIRRTSFPPFHRVHRPPDQQL